MKPDAFDHALDDIEVRLERLFTLYDQFLAGDQRIDPMGLQKDIGRRIVRLQGEANANGAAAARLTSILERYENMQRYWERLSGRMKSGAHQKPLPAEREHPRAMSRSASSGGWDTAKMEGPIRDSTLRGYSAERPQVPRGPLLTPLPRDPSKRRTPPLGTPAVHEPWAEAPSSRRGPSAAGREPELPAEPLPEMMPTSIRAPAFTETSKKAQQTQQLVLRDSAKTTKDLDADYLRETAVTKQDMKPPSGAEPLSGAETRRVNEPPVDANAAKTVPMLASPFSMDDRSLTAQVERSVPEDDVDTIPKFRLGGSGGFFGAGQLESERTPTGSELAQRAMQLASGVTPERVQEIQSLLLVMNPGALPVNVERLTKMLAETEAKLKALHGDRTVTFDVVMKDGKAVIKPIVR